MTDMVWAVLAAENMGLVTHMRTHVQTLDTHTHTHTIHTHHTHTQVAVS